MALQPTLDFLAPFQGRVWRLPLSDDLLARLAPGYLEKEGEA